MNISSIRFYAQNCWTAVGDIGTKGTPYQYNKNQEVTFKSSISVPNGAITTGGQVYAVGNVNGKNVYASTSMQAPTITATTKVVAPKVTVSNAPVDNTDATNKEYVNGLCKLYLHSIPIDATEGDYYFEGVINIYAKTSDSITNISSIYQKLGAASSTMIGGTLLISSEYEKATSFSCESDGSALYINSYDSYGSSYTATFTSPNIGTDTVVEIL